MISEKLIKQYELDGAVCIRGAVDQDIAASVLANIDALIADTNDRWTTIRKGGFSDRHLWPTMPWMYEFCANSRLPEIVGRLMRTREARLFFDHIFVRDAGTTLDTPWHQDRPYWPFKGRQIASTWVALTACDEASSAAQFVRGSHAWGKVFRPMAFSKEGGSSEFLGDNAAYEEYRISTQHPVTTRSSAGTCNPATRSYSVPKSFTVRNKTRIRRDDEPPCQSGTSVMMPGGIPRKEPILS